MLAFPVKFFQLAVCLKMFTVKYWGQGQQLCGALGSPGGDAGVPELRLAGTVSLISMAAPTDAFLRPPFTGRTPSPGSLTPGLPGLEPRMPHFWPLPPHVFIRARFLPKVTGFCSEAADHTWVQEYR